MRLVIGCTLAMLFSTSCVYAQAYVPDGAEPKTAREEEYGALVRAALGFAKVDASDAAVAADAAELVVKDVEAALGSIAAVDAGSEKARMESVVSKVTGLVAVDAQGPVAGPSQLPRKIERIDIAPSVVAQDLPALVRDASDGEPMGEDVASAEIADGAIDEIGI